MKPFFTSNKEALEKRSGASRGQWTDASKGEERPR